MAKLTARPGASRPQKYRHGMIAEARTTYQGPLESGVDLMAFEIGDKVTVRRPTEH